MGNTGIFVAISRSTLFVPNRAAGQRRIAAVEPIAGVVPVLPAASWPGDGLQRSGRA